MIRRHPDSALRAGSVVLMPRKPRIEVPGGYFHVTSRGVNGEAIAFEAADRTFWLSQLGRTVRRFDWVCVAFCMLSNHFHLVIQTPEPTLARGMEFLNGTYARGTNQRHGRSSVAATGRR
jgi:REP-associated tyrosine transposase